MFTNTISGLPAGSYTLVVSDANGHVTVQSITLTEPDPLVADLGPDQSYDFACACATLTPSMTGGCAPFTYAWNTGATTSSIDVCPGLTQNFTVNVTDANGCVATDVITVVKPPASAQLDRYVIMGLGSQDDAVGNNLIVNTGGIGHRGATGKLTIGSNNLVNDWVAGNDVVLGSNNAIGTLYRNFLSQGNGNFIGSDVTPVAIPLTPKVPCFPFFSGGANVSVPTGGTVTLTPGTYSLVNVAGGGTLQLAPGVYQFQMLTTGNNSVITPTTGPAGASDVFIFVNGSLSAGNNNTLNVNVYAKVEVNIGNLTGGLFRGTFIGGNRVTTGNKGQYWLASYCFANLPLCTNRSANDDTPASLTTLNVYPNPSAGEVTVQYTGAVSEDLRLSVTDMLGRELYVRDVKKFLGETEQQLDLRHLTPGMYMVQIRNGETVSNAQFVITR